MSKYFSFGVKNTWKFYSFFSFRIYGVLDVMSIERAGLELVREGRSAVEAEPGRTATRATVSKLEQNHFSFNSVDFNVIGKPKKHDFRKTLYFQNM